jgi:tetratricopeptide (TPR) repeat protein
VNDQARGLLLALAVGVVGVAAALLLLPQVGGEKQALSVADAREASGDRAGALQALLDCTAKDPRACACADAAEELAVDVGRYDDARRAVDHSQCAPSPRHDGGRAETRIATGDVAGGMQLADAVLATSHDEPHAAFARAWAMGDGPEAIALAERAVKAGRGLPALILLGSMRMRAGDLERARVAFDAAAREAPKDPRAVFDAAVIAQRQGRYHDAREGYLRALAIDPKMADARYNLVVLTRAGNADGEARHHLHELEAIAPKDPRIAALKAALGP